MANLLCGPTANITTQEATLMGSGDSIPANHFLRLAYSSTMGGPHSNFSTNVAGDNTIGQSTSFTATGLASAATFGGTYYYTIQELDTDGSTILDESAECSFTTVPYNPSCEILLADGDSIQIRICADWVAPDQQLQAVWSPTSGGSYDNVGGFVVGTYVVGQCVILDIIQPACETRYYKARVTPVPAEYEVDWSYAHMNRINGTLETVTLTLGDESDYPANQSVVDVDARADQGTWHVKSGTFPLPTGISQLHMGFTGTGGSPTLGNYLDSCSIVLRKTFPTVENLGEQLFNGSFEFPLVAPGIRSACQVIPAGGYALFLEEPLTPGIAWQTSAADDLIEFWDGPSDFDCAYAQPNLPISAHTGDQWAELSANLESELFQVVDLDIGKVDSPQECPAAVFSLVCQPATAITCTSAVINATQCGLLPMNLYAFQIAPTMAGPWTEQTALRQAPTIATSPQPISESLPALQPNTQYCYRVVVYDPDFDQPIGTSGVCCFTTDNCVVYCGMYFDPDDCILVDPGNGDPPYYYCFQF